MYAGVSVISTSPYHFVDSTEGWMKFLHEEYYRILKERLTADELDDPAARKRAMKIEVDWYNAEVRAYVEENPKGKKSVKFAVRTLTRMVSALVIALPSVNSIFLKATQLYESSGHHLLATLVHTDQDSKGLTKSVWFAGTELGRLVKEEYGTKVDSQTADITAMFRMIKMNSRGVERRLGILMTELSKSLSNHDKERMAMNTIFTYDYGQFLVFLVYNVGIRLKTRVENAFGEAYGKGTWISFPRLAVRHKLCIVDYPADTRLVRFSQGVTNNKYLRASEARAVVTPRLDALHQEFARQLGGSVQPDSAPKKAYRLEFWSEGNGMPFTLCRSTYRCFISQRTRN